MGKYSQRAGFCLNGHDFTEPVHLIRVSAALWHCTIYHRLRERVNAFLYRTELAKHCDNKLKLNLVSQYLPILEPIQHCLSYVDRLILIEIQIQEKTVVMEKRKKEIIFFFTLDTSIDLDTWIVSPKMPELRMCAMSNSTFSTGYGLLSWQLGFIKFREFYFQCVRLWRLSIDIQPVNKNLI